MKTLIPFVLSLLAAVASQNCQAASAWLIVARSGHHELMYGNGSGLRSVLQLGDRTVYGTSKKKIGVVSRDTLSSSTTLFIVDKATRKLSASWPLDALPVSQLSGPSHDVVVNENFAYFVGMRSSNGGLSIEENQLGGAFELIRVSLESGAIERFALPSEISNPRIASVQGTPIVYDSIGADAWKFDQNSRTLERLISERELSLSADAAHVDSAGAGARSAGYLFLSTSGVYRLAESGKITRLLDEKLMRDGFAKVPTQSGDSDGDAVALFPATTDGRSLIGVLRKHRERNEVVLLDPSSEKAIFRLQVPSGIVRESIASAPDGSLVYVDANTGAVVQNSLSGESRELWQLKQEIPDASVHLARVVEAL